MSGKMRTSGIENEVGAIYPKEVRLSIKITTPSSEGLIGESKFEVQLIQNRERASGCKHSRLNPPEGPSHCRP